MKLASYRSPEGPGLALVWEEHLYSLARLGQGLGSLSLSDTAAFADLEAFLAGGGAALETAARVGAALAAGKLDERGVQAAKIGPLTEAPLLPASPKARKVFALAGNFEEHVKESRSVKGFVDLRRKGTPRVFMKPPTTTLRASGDSIEIPPCGRQIDWEVELAVIIGTPARRVSAENAMSHVFGYCLLNDVSERGFRIWEREDSSEWDRFFDWLNGKWFDSFAPAGPYIVTKDEVPDPYGIELRLLVNGEVMQRDTTGNMIFNIETVIEFLSAFVTLEPGDIIAMGTPAGVGMARGIFLKPGDEVVAEGSGLGRLVNAVVSAQ